MLFCVFFSFFFCYVITLNLQEITPKSQKKHNKNLHFVFLTYLPQQNVSYIIFLKVKKNIYHILYGCGAFTRLVTNLSDHVLNCCIFSIWML